MVGFCLTVTLRFLIRKIRLVSNHKKYFELKVENDNVHWPLAFLFLF